VYQRQVRIQDISVYSNTFLGSQITGIAVLESSVRVITQTTTTVYTAGARYAPGSGVGNVTNLDGFVVKLTDSTSIITSPVVGILSSRGATNFLRRNDYWWCGDYRRCCDYRKRHDFCRRHDCCRHSGRGRSESLTVVREGPSGSVQTKGNPVGRVPFFCRKTPRLP